MENKIKVRTLKQEPRHTQNINVTANTFGCSEIYDLETVNVSKNGLLTGSLRNTPFIVNTLLEITIDPSSTQFIEPIICLGKVVRIAEEKREETDQYSSLLGISITEGLEFGIHEWETYLEDLEQDASTILLARQEADTELIK